MGPEIVLMVILAGAIGAAIGTFTGLVPGIHVNTAATILLGMYPLLEGIVSGFSDPGTTPVLLSCCIMSASVVHSFVDFVPSVFIGVPDSEDVVSILPGHRLYKQGLGMTAVRAAAIGSTVGSISALALAVPLQWMMFQGATEIADCLTTGVLLVTLAVILLNSGDRFGTLVLILASGSLGYIIDLGIIPVYGILSDGTLLFPLLTGLFGLPPLLEKTGGRRRTLQRDPVPDPTGPVPGIKGVVTGLIAGWFPGVTSTAGAVLASSFTRENDPARFISLTASIGTVTSVFSIVTLSVTGSGRSGTSQAIKTIIGDSLGGFCSETFMLILLSMAFASMIGYAATIESGKLIVAVSEKIPADLMNDAILALIVILVTAFTGPFGLVVLMISCAIGMIPPSIGVSRVCLTGCLIVPTLVSNLG